MLAYQSNNNNNNNGWFLDGSIGIEPDYGALTVPYMTEHLGFIDPSTPSTSTPSMGDVTVAKKLNHNASERDRRKKINSFYSSLRSLLPPADKKKKVSIPTTVSWVLNYIPELQQQVQMLNQQKDHLLSKVSKDTGVVGTRPQRSTSELAVSVSRLSQEELVFQISKEKVVGVGDNTVPFSEILGNLEKDGFFLINASTFETFGGRRLFYTIHVKCGRNMAIMDSEALIKMMVSYCEEQRGDIGKINIPYSNF